MMIKKNAQTTQLMQKMLHDYNAVIKKRALGIYKNILNGVRESFEAAKKTRFKRLIATQILGVLYPVKLKDKKYIFIGLRYKDLLSILPKNEIILICSSKSEILFAIQRGIAFISSVEISHHFQEAHFDHRTKSLELYIDKYYQLFEKINSHCYLILTSDTKPVDIFFSRIAYCFKDYLRVLCIQHGIFPDMDKNLYVAEGASVEFNILYAESQKQYASKYIKSSEFLVMGPPWNIQYVQEQGDREVILVGTGGGDSCPDEYKSSVEMFQLVSKILHSKNVVHAYRPHGTESVGFVNGLFESIDARSKDDLLSGVPKVFIGFNSTLMFEAYICGHTVYGIESNEMFSRTTFPINASFSIENLNEMCERVAKNIVVNKKSEQIPTIPPLSERFHKMIRETEMKISNKQFKSKSTADAKSKEVLIK